MKKVLYYKMIPVFLLKNDHQQVHACMYTKTFYNTESTNIEYISMVQFSLYSIGEQDIHCVGLGGSVGCAVRLETRRSRVQPPPRSATFFRGD